MLEGISVMLGRSSMMPDPASALPRPVVNDAGLCCSDYGLHVSNAEVFRACPLDHAQFYIGRRAVSDVALELSMQPGTLRASWTEASD
jgi:hypothetical protein